MAPCIASASQTQREFGQAPDLRRVAGTSKYRR
jgi:hypothetical protein